MMMTMIIIMRRTMNMKGPTGWPSADESRPPGDAYRAQDRRGGLPARAFKFSLPLTSLQQ
jgi:hypothetical protein